MDKKFQETIKFIMSAIKEKGYNPIAQITGYLIYKDSSYITRHNNARNIIEMLDFETIRHYMESKYKTQALLGHTIKKAIE